MSLPSFQDWLDRRSHEAPAADNLATLIAQSGTAGISIDCLRRIVNLPPETLEDILRSLMATGQVSVVKVNGEMRYRVAG